MKMLFNDKDFVIDNLVKYLDFEHVFSSNKRFYIPVSKKAMRKIDNGNNNFILSVSFKNQKFSTALYIDNKKNNVTLDGYELVAILDELRK